MAEEEKKEEQTKEKAKTGVGKKILKAVLWIFAAGLTVIVLALASSPLWLGPLAKNIANAKVPEITGCEFKLEELSVNLFSGRVFLRDCHLKNPPGYKSDEAFSVATVVVDVAVCSLLSDEIHVETIEINRLRASYLSDSKGVNNFDRMFAKSSEAPQEEAPVEKKPEEPAKEEDGKPGPKVIIDHFELTDSKVSYGIIRGTPPITLPLPSVVLNDIGKDKEGGTTFADALDTIWNACLKVAGSAGEQVKKLGSAVGEAASAAAEVVGDAASAKAAAVGDAAGATAEAVGNAAGKAVDAVGNAAGKAADAAGKAMKSIGGLFSGDGKDDSK